VLSKASNVIVSAPDFLCETENFQPNFTEFW
jgi:hypothetical protein